MTYLVVNQDGDVFFSSDMESEANDWCYTNQGKYGNQLTVVEEVI